MSRNKVNGKSRMVSANFLKEVSEKVCIINTLSKDSGVEIPNELEETLKEMSISSNKREVKLDSLNSSVFSQAKEPEDEFEVAVESSVLNSSVDSGSVKQLKMNSNMLCQAVKDKLQEFRTLNKQSRNSGIKATQDLKTYRDELIEMKNSVVEIIDEAQEAKEHIHKLKEKVENEEENFEEYDMSLSKPVQETSQLLIEQIKELHQEIYLIQARIEKSEQDLRNKELENKELKGIIEQLNDSFERFGDENEDHSGTCQNCEVV